MPLKPPEDETGYQTETHSVVCLVDAVGLRSEKVQACDMAVSAGVYRGRDASAC